MYLALEKYLDRTDLCKEVEMLNIINNKLSELYPVMFIDGQQSLLQWLHQSIHSQN
jgi:hypothetical protein